MMIVNMLQWCIKLLLRISCDACMNAVLMYVDRRTTIVQTYPGANKVVVGDCKVFLRIER